jgi:hypothetical protein
MKYFRWERRAAASAWTGALYDMSPKVNPGEYRHGPTHEVNDELGLRDCMKLFPVPSEPKADLPALIESPKQFAASEPETNPQSSKAWVTVEVEWAQNPVTGIWGWQRPIEHQCYELKANSPGVLSILAQPPVAAFIADAAWGAIEEIAQQHLISEMDEEQKLYASFEDGYEECIKRARQALEGRAK